MTEANTEYLVEYNHEGKRWGFSIFAVDYPDAVEKVRNLRDTAVLLGKLGGSIDAGDSFAIDFKKCVDAIDVKP